eukprot:3919424-Pyramimonas_sp.AAC.1
MEAREKDSKLAEDYTEELARRIHAASVAHPHAAPATLHAFTSTAVDMMAQTGAPAQLPHAAGLASSSPCARRRSSPEPRSFRGGASAAPTPIGSGPHMSASVRRRGSSRPDREQHRFIR